MQLRGIFLTLVWSVLSGQLGQASFVTSPEEIKDISFDFIVIGGGAGGNAVANRLTENSKFNVLLLEAGPSNAGVLESEVPFLGVDLANPSPYDWNYTTVAMPGLGGRAIPYPRGHILGGSSSTNWMVYTRAASQDWDRYAAITGDEGWSWNNVVPYFKKSEIWTAPADNHNITGQFDPTIHGRSGLVGVSLPGFPTPINNAVIEATQQLGGDFAFNLDTNSGSPLGIGWAQTTIKGKSRSSSATAYLSSNFVQRPNLKIMLNTQVSRVLPTSTGNTGPVLRGVEFRQSVGGSLLRLNATKEVILSAGSVGTPHILLNSGVGDSASLKAFGITPLVDLPDVGENLSDHPVIGNAWISKSNNTFETLRRDPVLAAAALAQWEKNGTGPYVNTILSHIGYGRVQSSLVPSPDPAAGPDTPHFEYIFSNGIPPDTVPPTGNFVFATTVLVSPSSRGSIKLNSSNPFDAPLIDPALLNSDWDKTAMREALRGAKTFMAAPAWSDLVTPADPLASATTDEELDAYSTANAGTLFHPAGTAAMSPKGSTSGVVDPDLRVKKVVGLRIVDASVLPIVPSAHTQAPVYVVAERAADLIKALYK